MKTYSTEEIESIAVQFSNRTLPKAEWTHHAHLIIALWHHWNYDEQEAIQLVRKKIIAYNEAVGTPNTDNSGYHETLTIFWMHITKQYLKQHHFENLAKAINAFLNSEYANNQFPLSYYTREKLFSIEARKVWINGDLKKI
jgi:hypothetical protein